MSGLYKILSTYLPTYRPFLYTVYNSKDLVGRKKKHLLALLTLDKHLILWMRDLLVYRQYVQNIKWVESFINLYRLYTGSLVCVNKVMCNKIAFYGMVSNTFVG